MLWFEPNRGQVNAAVQVLAHTRAGYVRDERSRTRRATGRIAATFRVAMRRTANRGSAVWPGAIRLRRAHKGYAAALPASGIGDGEWPTGSGAVRRHRAGTGLGSESDQFAASERHHERPAQHRCHGRYCVE